MVMQSDLTNSEREEVWNAWPVSWSAIWVGALSALAALTVFGLAGIVLKLHAAGTPGRIDDWHKVGMGTVACSVLSSFFAFVIGSWVAGKIGGFRRSEPAMLHGAIVWLLSIPLLLGVLAIGGGGAMGSWHSNLGSKPVWVDTPAVTTTTTVDAETAQRLAEEAARAARNGALAAVTALLLGLIGSILGGWMASGEPMTFTHHLTRGQRTAASIESGDRLRERISV